MASSTDSARPKVLYVMGSGHSGSTILGVTLGNCAGVFYAGELDNWLTRSGVSALGGTERTRFWQAVRERVDGAESLFGGHVLDSLERSSSRLRPGMRATRRSVRNQYPAVTEQLYRALADIAEASTIVDTAHFPLRAHELQRLDGIDLYLLFLVRDPQSIVASFSRPFDRQDAERRFRILSTNADLWLTHLLSVWVFNRQPRARRLLLSHEDFLADPEGMLQRLLDFIDSPAEIPDMSTLSTGYPIQGNRLIKSDVVALKARVVHAPKSSLLTRLAQMPWQRVFSRLEPKAVAVERGAGVGAGAGAGAGAGGRPGAG